MTGVLRRYSADSGDSWRKWQDPLAAGRALRSKRRVRLALFWLVCIDAGALLALLVGR